MIKSNTEFWLRKFDDLRYRWLRALNPSGAVWKIVDTSAYNPIQSQPPCVGQQVVFMRKLVSSKRNIHSSKVITTQSSKCLRAPSSLYNKRIPHQFGAIRYCYGRSYRGEVDGRIAGTAPVLSPPSDQTHFNRSQESAVVTWSNEISTSYDRLIFSYSEI